MSNNNVFNVLDVDDSDDETQQTQPKLNKKQNRKKDRFLRETYGDSTGKPE